jgi:NAD(P)-dependent dehydrogenase (short-subunit alcohol dehydrogenase family)
MKTIIVTGGNRGIGLEICRQLADLGHRVIMGSRNVEAGRKAAENIHGDVIAQHLDVTDGESIRALYDFVNTGFGKLDVLINNAGVIEASFDPSKSAFTKTREFIESNVPGARKLKELLAPLLKKSGIIPLKHGTSEISLDVVRQIAEVNLYGAWNMIQVFLPLLRKSKEGRIINVSSGMGEFNGLQSDHAGYRMSKVALNALTLMFSRELKDIRVNAMCPGWVRTGMGGENAPRNVSQGADTAVWLAIEKEIPTGKFFRDRKIIDW